MTIDDPLDRREDVTSPEYPLPVKVNTFSVLGLSFDNFVMNNKLARRTLLVNLQLIVSFDKLVGPGLFLEQISSYHMWGPTLVLINPSENCSKTANRVQTP